MDFNPEIPFLNPLSEGEVRVLSHSDSGFPLIASLGLEMDILEEKSIGFEE
jgi:hypothetical protein